MLITQLKVPAAMQGTLWQAKKANPKAENLRKLYCLQLQRGTEI